EDFHGGKYAHIICYNQRMGKKKRIVVAVSGGFDPVHIGHIEMFERAKKLGDVLVVILNNDNWLEAKKGYVFMRQAERKKILESLRPVDRVMYTKHPKNPKDMSVTKELIALKPDIFANGGDRKSHNTPEDDACEKYGIRRAYNLGEKIQSSSEL